LSPRGYEKNSSKSRKRNKNRWLISHFGKKKRRVVDFGEREDKRSRRVYQEVEKEMTLEARGVKVRWRGLREGK